MDALARQQSLDPVDVPDTFAHEPATFTTELAIVLFGGKLRVSPCQLQRLNLRNLFACERTSSGSLEKKVYRRISQQCQTDFPPYRTYGDLRRSSRDLRRLGLRKVDSEAARYEVFSRGVVDDEDRRTGTIKNAKRDIFAQILPRPPGKLLLYAHNADGRTAPLRCGRQVEQVSQEYVSG